jgi:hypothetical protein
MSLKTFTENQKTILSIDFDRSGTCLQRCSYCYVDNMERIYPAYLDKIHRNNILAETKPEEFSKRLNDEYLTALKSKSKKFERLDKLSIRVYGSGDFIPVHAEFLKNLNFPHFLISKNLTTPAFRQYIDILLSNKNMTTVQLSFDAQNLVNYEALRSLYGTDRVGFSYTGLTDEFIKVKESGYKFDVFFNIAKTKEQKKLAALQKEACPADGGRIKLQKACSYCNKCWGNMV